MTRIDHIAVLSVAGRSVPGGAGASGMGGLGRVPSTISTMTTTTMPSRAGTG